MKVCKVLPIIAVVLSIGCAGDSGSSSPAAPSPRVAQVGGLWAYSSTLTAISGGECIGPMLQAVVGRRTTGTIRIQQAGAILTATFTADQSGANCTYSGTAGSSSFALNVMSCTANDLLGVTCPDGSVRNVRLTTGGVNASVNGGTAVGTEADTYNVTTTSGAAIAAMTRNSNFGASKR